MPNPPADSGGLVPKPASGSGVSKGETLAPGSAAAGSGGLVPNPSAGSTGLAPNRRKSDGLNSGTRTSWPSGAMTTDPGTMASEPSAGAPLAPAQRPR